ncbi:MAG: Ig-like domain-containing protein [Deltaproteobacteria bacterium]|nr:Ig-like domain-containing protein [Deltaproteobacteria bacterium]
MKPFSLSLVVIALSLGCGVPPPDRLEVNPPTPIKADELGKTVELQASAFRGIVAHDDVKAPLVVTWSSSDPAVASVDKNGKVTATGSGKAKIEASVPGVGGKPVVADVVVDNLIVDTIAATGDFPKVFKLDSKPVPLTVVVKNEKGVVVEKPKLRFRASDYCVEVTPEGMVHPLAVGECSVIVELAGKTAKIDLDVKE